MGEMIRFMCQIPCLFVLFVTVQSFDGWSVCYNYSTEEPASPGPPSECDSTSAVHIWNNIQLNCSVPNTLTISYSDYAGLPGYRKTIDYRAVEQVKVECVSQDLGIYVNCTHYPSYLPSTGEDAARVDSYTFPNLNESGILPGWTCFVRGCYRNEIPGEDDNIVLTPEKNCTVRLETSSTIPTPSSALPTVSTKENSHSVEPTIMPTTVFTSEQNNIETSSTIPIPSSALPTVSTKENSHSVEPTIMPTTVFTSEQNNIDNDATVMVLLYASPVLVFLILFVFVLLIFIQYSKKKQKARARKALLVLDEKDMKFDPDHAPPVCIDKPSLSFSHRISVVSADFIQNLKPAAVQISLGVAVAADSIRYISAVHNSIWLGDNKHTDDSNELPESDADYYNIQSAELPGTSLDHCSDNTLQLMTLEEEMSQSTTHDSLNTLRNTCLQDDTLNTAEYSDTLQAELTSDDNQMTALRAGDNMINLDQQDPSSESGYLPSNSIHISHFSNSIPPKPDDITQLDLPANEEHNSEDFLSRSQNYIKYDIIGLQNQHQDLTQLPSALADTQCTLPRCSPTTMLDDFEHDTTGLGALDVDGSLASEQLSPTNVTINPVQDDENLELVSTIDCHRYTEGNNRQSARSTAQEDEGGLATEKNSRLIEDSTTKHDLEGYPSTEQPPPSSIATYQDDDSLHMLDLDKGSMVSFELGGNVYDYDSQNCSHVEHQNTIRAQNTNGYLSGSSYIESSIHMHPPSSDFVCLPSHS